MKAAVIGAGRFGQNHVRTLSEMGALLAVAELNPEVRNQASTTYNVPGFANHEELLAASIDGESVQAVCIATPAPFHYAVAKTCLEKGVHCLVEKPLTLDVSEAEELVQVAKANRAVLMVGHLLIYQPAVSYLREAIQRGDIGQLLSLHQERLNLGKARNQENALWSLGVHDVAVAMHLNDHVVKSVKASGTAHFTPGVQDDTYVHIEFENGVVAHIHSSWHWPEQRRRLVAVGSKAMLVYDEVAQSVTLVKKSISANLENVDAGSEIVFEGFGKPLQIELEHFLACAESGAPPKSDGQSGIEVVKVLNQAFGGAN